MNHEKYMVKAFYEALTGMRNNMGGPFGAIIVADGKVIGKGCNSVTSTNDPTAHAEIVAIRDACARIKHFHLKNAVIYTNCEPCPMCLAAIYWANIKKVFYVSDRNDAARIGFDDKFIYDELTLSSHMKSIEISKLHLPLVEELFNEWEIKKDKKLY